MKYEEYENILDLPDKELTKRVLSLFFKRLDDKSINVKDGISIVLEGQRVFNDLDELLKKK
jgi:hypothetical protein